MIGISIKLILSAGFLVLLAGCARGPDAVSCDSGYQKAQQGKFSEAIPSLNACIASPDMMPGERRSAYVARAWAQYNLRNIAAAAADQEAAFRISDSNSYAELINYALYLRLAGRVEESLAPLQRAGAIEERDGRESIMTQYQLGWTLQELGRHTEAIGAFSRGIPHQPDYPFVYFRRGISLDALGRRDEARSDFVEGMRLAKQRGEDLSVSELASIRQKLAEYGVH